MSSCGKLTFMTTTLTPNLTRRSELIELDGRKRAPLRGLARHERYLVSADDDGTLVLTPAVVMTELEAALLGKNPELLGRLKESTAHPERLVRHRLSEVSSEGSS